MGGGCLGSEGDPVLEFGPDAFPDAVLVVADCHVIGRVPGQGGDAVAWGGLKVGRRGRAAGSGCPCGPVCCQQGHQDKRGCQQRELRQPERRQRPGPGWCFAVHLGSLLVDWTVMIRVGVARPARPAVPGCLIFPFPPPWFSVPGPRSALYCWAQFMGVMFFQRVMFFQNLARPFNSRFLAPGSSTRPGSPAQADGCPRSLCMCGKALGPLLRCPIGKGEPVLARLCAFLVSQPPPDGWAGSLRAFAPGPGGVRRVKHSSSSWIGCYSCPRFSYLFGANRMAESAVEWSSRRTAGGPAKSWVSLRPYRESGRVIATGNGHEVIAFLLPFRAEKALPWPSMPALRSAWLLSGWLPCTARSRPAA